MSPVLFLSLMCLMGFLAGGIPFGFLLGRVLLKDDIRNHGSGNIGATNVGRVLGWNWGGLVLLLDALKGLLPTLAAASLAASRVPEIWQQHVTVATALSCIVGHMYPVYLKLRGGKGVATALGVVLVLAPQASAAALLVFVLVLAGTKRMALASMLGATAFGGCYLLQAGPAAWTAEAASMTGFAVLVPVLIVWRHRSNIVRLLNGTEPPVTEKVAVAATEPSEAEPTVGNGATRPADDSTC